MTVASARKARPVLTVAYDTVNGRGQCPPWMRAYAGKSVNTVRVSKSDYVASDGKKYTFTIWYLTNGKLLHAFISEVVRSRKIIEPSADIKREILLHAASARKAFQII